MMRVVEWKVILWQPWLSSRRWDSWWLGRLAAFRSARWFTLPKRFQPWRRAKGRIQTPPPPQKMGKQSQEVICHQQHPQKTKPKQSQNKANEPREAQGAIVYKGCRNSTLRAEDGEKWQMRPRWSCGRRSAAAAGRHSLQQARRCDSIGRGPQRGAKLHAKRRVRFDPSDTGESCKAALCS
jgi:hypothetical protein